MTKHLLLSCFLVFAPSLCFAEKIEITVVGAQFPPYFTNQPPLYGITGEIIQLALKDSDFLPTFKIKPFARALSEAKEGKADIISALYQTKEREKHLIYTDNLITSDILLYQHSTRNLTYDSLDSLSDQRIGLIRSTSTRLSLSNNPNIRLFFINHYLQGLEMLRLDRLDFMIGDQLVIEYLLNKHEHKLLSQELKPTYPALKQEQTFIAISKKSPYNKELLNKFNQELSALKTSKQLEHLIQKHLTHNQH
ncbi:substrate-binding periplasmic protein [Litoribrevibacter euphylliae]|uniref:Substrate-binding periplasmic protein n=1 Tax=Litoribrevibacter euphylliae TaxID=1834034 RepID=A0ABV7HLR3_9GAMM